MTKKVSVDTSTSGYLYSQVALGKRNMGFDIYQGKVSVFYYKEGTPNETSPMPLEQLIKLRDGLNAIIAAKADLPPVEPPTNATRYIAREDEKYNPLGEWFEMDDGRILYKSRGTMKPRAAITSANSLHDTEYFTPAGRTMVND